MLHGSFLAPPRLRKTLQSTGHLSPQLGLQAAPSPHRKKLWPLYSDITKEKTVYSPTQPDGIENEKIRCVVAHDHVLLRQGLRRLLEDEPDMEVVAEAGNAAEALQRVFEHRPEVVIAGAGIFECGADQVERLILQESPKSKVLFLTASESDQASWDALYGTSCAVRHTSSEELVEMVRMAHGGRAAVREMQLDISIDDRRNWPVPELPPRQRVLTAREREVLKLLAEGRTVRSAADVLGLSVKTVDAHKFNLMRKLGIHNKAELVMWAIQKKVVKLPANY
jgi:two-component system response regulator NreC